MIPNWREAWKFYSMWIFGAVILFPELYTEARALGLIKAEWIDEILRGLGIIGIAVRLIGQGKPDA